MSTTTEKTVADLVASINGKDVLSGWDVLVCYHEDDLNKLLQTRHDTIDKDANVSVIPQFKAEYKDPIRKGTMIDLYYDLKLGGPSMKLISKQGSIQLRYALSGQFGYQPSGDKESIESGYFLNCVATLKNVEGSLTSGDKTPTKDAGEIVTFENGKTTECHVTIDMLNPEVSVVDSNGNKAVAMDAIVGSNLFTHIRSVGLQYNLAGISTKVNGATSKSHLIPSKFLMTTVSGTGSERSALLMWIAVENMPFHGLPNTENTPLRFAPDSKTQILPIPKDKGASIYLSRELIYSSLIKPGLENLKCTNIALNESSTALKDGIAISATPPEHQIDVPKWLPDGSEEGEGNKVCDGFSFNLNQTAMSLTLAKSGSELKIEHTVKDARMKIIHFAGTADGSIYHQDSEGKVDFKLTAQCTGNWTDDDNSEKVAIKFELPRGFKVEPKNHDDPSVFQKYFLGHIEGTLQGMDQISVPVPKLELDFGAISYFLATNLLFPGQHIYKSGKIPDELYVPHDMLILGTIG